MALKAGFALFHHEYLISQFTFGGPQRPCIEPSDSKVVEGLIESVVSGIKGYLSGIGTVCTNEILVWTL